MPVLDHKMIMRYKVWNRGESHPRGLGFIIALSDPHPEPNPMASSSSTAAPRRVLSEEVQQEVNGQLYNLRAQNVRLAERQDTIFGYIVSFNNALVDMFSRLNSTMVPSQFPVLPTLPVFPPSDQEDESYEEIDHAN